MSVWSELYGRLMRLSREWAVHEHPGVNRQLFNAAVLSVRSDGEVVKEFESFGVGLPSIWDEARDVQRLMQFPSRGRHADDPCEDVYEAALTMMPHGTWTPSPEHDQLYRGQRDARWAVIPSIFRLDDQARLESLDRLNARAAAISEERADLSADQALALIQHYSAELGTPTWLLDLTWDPAVALFFASLGGVTGDIGIVTMLVRHEWERFSAGGANRLGQIRVIEVPGVLRIERQRALFLDTSHPDLLEQYVAHSVWFRQVEGLVFEDRDADWPVTRESCYPDHDPTLDLLGRLSDRSSEQAGPWLAPPADASEHLHADDYLAIALSWCDEDGVELEPLSLDVLGAVCRVYSDLQAQRGDVGVTLRSLHRLREAVEMIERCQEDDRAIDVEEALRWTLSRTMTDDERALLESLIAGEAPDRPLLDTVSELLDELPPSLAQLIAFGARDAADDRVERDIQAALGNPRFRVFDLRGARDLNGIAALATAIGGAVRLLLVDAETSQEWLGRLVHASLDGRERIEFAQGWVDLPAEQRVVVVYYGANSIADMPPALADVLIVQFV
jgi:hypothetical protein